MVGGRRETRIIEDRLNAKQSSHAKAALDLDSGGYDTVVRRGVGPWGTYLMCVM